MACDDTYPLRNFDPHVEIESVYLIPNGRPGEPVAP